MQNFIETDVKLNFSTRISNHETLSNKRSVSLNSGNLSFSVLVGVTY